MFIASKFEDIYPLKMKTVFEKIAHKKIDIQKIKELELDIMKNIEYKIHSPTIIDFLKSISGKSNLANFAIPIFGFLHSESSDKSVQK